MKQTLAIVHQAFKDHVPAIAYSGGVDSTVLLDIVAAAGYRPPVIFSDSQMEYPDSLRFVRQVAAEYKLPCHIARAEITPLECWQLSGYPMLGKMAARIWMQRRPARTTGFKLDVSSCCRTMKIQPARALAKAIGCDAMLTGQRGAADDMLRAMRAHRDGPTTYLKHDELWQINPLTGWTDDMVARYTRAHHLPAHPQRARGAITIGCMYCGGGAQYDNSGFRVLRKTDPKAWDRMMVEYGFAGVIIAIKYDVPLAVAHSALDALGGVEAAINQYPHAFDFLRKRPLKGYDK